MAVDVEESLVARTIECVLLPQDDHIRGSSHADPRPDHEAADVLVSRADVARGVSSLAPYNFRIAAKLHLQREREEWGRYTVE